MNTCGRVFRLSLYGESHGPAIGVLVDGCPPGIPLSVEDLSDDMSRRRGGRVGTTPRREADLPAIDAGVFEGHTTGAPLALRIDNRDVRSEDYDTLRFVPRPGHADLTARQRSGGWNDPRGGGHFSGRITAALVAAGVIARRIIAPAVVTARLEAVRDRTDIDAAVLEALDAGDSVGGLIACTVTGLPPGLGEPFFDSVESVISHLLFAIPGIKAVEFGAGFDAARMTGVAFNDRFVDADGRTETNHSGGINGGLTNGNPLLLRVAMRPPASISRPQRSIDLRTSEPVDLVISGRHDGCIALRTPVIVEAAVATALADLVLLRRAQVPMTGEDS